MPWHRFEAMSAALSPEEESPFKAADARDAFAAFREARKKNTQQGA